MLLCLVNLKTDKFACKLAKCPSSLFGRLRWCPVLWPCVYFQSWKFHLCLHLAPRDLIGRLYYISVAQVLLTLPCIFIFPTGFAIWDSISAFLWVGGKLDCLSH
ncbi:unnamed protein product [Prunus armeniaca]